MKAEELLHTCLDAGVNFFDTGSNYSQGNAEVRLGKFLQGRREQIILATKVGSRLMPNGKVRRDFSPEGMEASLLKSLQKLRTDHVDLLLLHGPPPGILQNDDVLKTLESFKTRGLINYTGVSGDGQVAEKSAGMTFFNSLMITYNVVTQQSASIIKQASESGQAVLIKSPLAHHVFSNELFKLTKMRKIWYLLRVLKNYRNILWKGRHFRYLNTIEGWTATEAALKFILRNPYVSSAVIGTTNIHHLIENLKVSAKKDLPKDLIKRIETTSQTREV